MTILWLTASNFSSAQKSMLHHPLKAAGLSVNQISFVNIHRKVGALARPTGKKTKQWVPNQNKLLILHTEIQSTIKTYKPSVIVINDENIYQLLTGKEITLGTARGSTFYIDNIPCIVFDSVLKLNFSDRAHKGGNKSEKDIRWYSWVFIRDCAKLKRFVDNTTRQVPKFTWELVETIEQLEVLTNKVLEQGACCAIDIETSNRLITCIGYSVLMGNGQIKSFVVPFVDTTKESGHYWRSENEEAIAWELVRKLNASPIPKCFQNGVLYDNSYLLHYQAPVENVLLDSYQLFHSVWAEAPRTLGFICSVVCDYYHWHKDETDELNAKADKASEKKWIPQTRTGLEIFWEYNALDCYYTLIACVHLAAHMPDWAWQNYVREFSLQLGYGLVTTSIGFKIDTIRQTFKAHEQHEEYDQHLKTVRTMTDDKEFNPHAPEQVRHIVYDVFKTPVLKKRGKFSGETTDKRMLRILGDKYPLQKIFIDKVFECKEAANNAAKYGTLKPSNGRMLYQLNMSGTATTRGSSSAHPLKFGTNLQNVPKDQRDLLIADRGYLLFDIDYSQSDFYYTAYTLQDPEMMAIIEDPRDTHCLQAAYFFQRSYEEIYKGKQEGADWVVHPVKGCRQNQKRISYGANYLMAGFTLYTTLGHESALATAVAMGHSKALDWSQHQLVNFCGDLVNKYWKRFHVGWHNLHDIIEETHKRAGAFIDPWGRVKIFFGNVKDDGVKRKIAAEIGQAGTAGAINRALQTLVYQTEFEKQGGYIMPQVHDSITVMIPEERYDLLKLVVQCLRQPLTIHGRTFEVPTEGGGGLSWGKGLLEFDIHDDEIYTDHGWKELKAKIYEHENKLRTTYGQDLLELR